MKERKQCTHHKTKGAWDEKKSMKKELIRDKKKWDFEHHWKEPSLLPAMFAATSTNLYAYYIFHHFNLINHKHSFQTRLYINQDYLNYDKVVLCR